MLLVIGNDFVVETAKGAFINRFLRANLFIQMEKGFIYDQIIVVKQTQINRETDNDHLLTKAIYVIL